MPNDSAADGTLDQGMPGVECEQLCPAGRGDSAVAGLPEAPEKYFGFAGPGMSRTPCGLRLRGESGHEGRDDEGEPS